MTSERLDERMVDWQIVYFQIMAMAFKYEKMTIIHIYSSTENQEVIKTKDTYMNFKNI